MTMRLSTVKLIVVGALLLVVGATVAYKFYNAHREAAIQAAVDKDLDRLAAPAPRRKPVTLRPGGR